MTATDRWLQIPETSIPGLSRLHEVAKAINRLRPDSTMMPGSNYAIRPTYVWRGVRDATWGFHSGLSRWFQERYGCYASEHQLSVIESGVLLEARKWGLGWGNAAAPLSSLELLALLQHYGSPTWLIDVTVNPLVALWFAVESDDLADGRLFALDVAERGLTEADRAATDVPWMTGSFPSDAMPAWRTTFYGWRPPPMDQRIRSQASSFLVGGVPSDEIERESSALTLSMADFQVATDMSRVTRGSRGRPSFTFRIPASAKEELRKTLKDTYGIAPKTSFSDPTGFSRFASSWQGSDRVKPAPSTRSGLLTRSRVALDGLHKLAPAELAFWHGMQQILIEECAHHGLRTCLR